MAQSLFDGCNSHQRQPNDKTKFVGCSLLKILSAPQVHDAGYSERCIDAYQTDTCNSHTSSGNVLYKRTNSNFPVWVTNVTYKWGGNWQNGSRTVNKRCEPATVKQVLFILFKTDGYLVVARVQRTILTDINGKADRSSRGEEPHGICSKRIRTLRNRTTCRYPSRTNRDEWI